MAGGKAENYIQVYEDRMGITAAKQARKEVEKVQEEVDQLIIKRRELQKKQIILSRLLHVMPQVWNTKERQDLIHQMIKASNAIQNLDNLESLHFEKLKLVLSDCHEKERAKDEKTKFVINKSVRIIIGMSLSPSWGWGWGS